MDFVQMPNEQNIQYTQNIISQRWKLTNEMIKDDENSTELVKRNIIPSIASCISEFATNG